MAGLANHTATLKCPLPSRKGADLASITSALPGNEPDDLTPNLNFLTLTNEIMKPHSIGPTAGQEKQLLHFP